MSSVLSVLRFSFGEISDLEKTSLENLLEMIIERFLQYGSKKDIEKINAAFLLGKDIHSFQKRETGVPYFSHPLIATLLMMEYCPDIDIIVAMILHDSVEDSLQPEEVRIKIATYFGESVLYLIEGVSKVFTSRTPGENSVQTIEKLFALAEKDVRILIIKLFDRLHNTITILGKKDRKKREKKLKETIRIYVPLAERLGLWSVKKKLEDAALLGISEHEYSEMVLFQKKGTHLQDSLRYFFTQFPFSSPFEVEIKNFSISSLITFKKKNPFIQPEETFFVRLILPEKEDCYSFLEAISKVIPQKKSFFSDFILKKKENGYRSLHSVHIFQNEYPVFIHIVSQKMRKQNDLGIFLKLKSKKYSISLLQNTNIHQYLKESEDFISFLSSEILNEKITIHGKDFQESSLPHDARVIDVLLIMYPKTFSYFSKAFVNNRPVDLFEHLEDHDIVNFTFREIETITSVWKQYTSLISSQSILDSYFEKQDIEFKKENGKAIIQPLLDELHLGLADDIINQFPLIKEDLGVYTGDDIFIALYEGKISSSEFISSLNSQKSKSWRRWFSFLDSSSLVSRVKFFCHNSTIPLECTQKLFDISAEHSVQVSHLSADFDVKNNVVKGDIILKSKKESQILELLQSFSVFPNFSFHVVPAWQFWVKMAIGVIFPLLTLVGIFYFLFSPYASHFLEFLYISVFLIIFVNVFCYLFFSKYFRYKESFLLLLVSFNLLTAGFFLFFFFQKGFDIFHIDFFLPLIALLFSIAIPVFLASKKEINIKNSSAISLEEWKKKQKEKRIGYMLRFSSVLIWGIEPILIRYSPFSVISPLEKLFLYAVGAFFVLTVLFIIQKIFIDKTKNISFQIPFNKYFLFIFLGFFFLNYLTFHALLHTNGTNFILLNNFAPTFALLVAYIFWRNTILYFQEKKHALMVFGVFLLGGIGSSFLFYNDFLKNDFSSLLGNSFAIMAIVFDALIVISQIKYTKFLKGDQSFLVNIYLFGILFLVMLPFVASSILSFPTESLLWGVFTGGLIGIALMLNYETFKRMDGFIAYLMLNISVFITFILETFVLHAIIPTWLILIGGLLIIGASIAAEYINTLAEKKQIKSS